MRECCDNSRKATRLWLCSYVFVFYHAVLPTFCKTENIQYTVVLQPPFLWTASSWQWYSSALTFIVQALRAGYVGLSASTVHEAGGHQTQQAVCLLTVSRVSEGRLRVNRVFFSENFVVYSMYKFALSYHWNHIALLKFLGLAWHQTLSMTQHFPLRDCMEIVCIRRGLIFIFCLIKKQGLALLA